MPLASVISKLNLGFVRRRFIFYNFLGKKFDLRLISHQSQYIYTYIYIYTHTQCMRGRKLQDPNVPNFRTASCLQSLAMMSYSCLLVLGLDGKYMVTTYSSACATDDVEVLSKMNINILSNNRNKISFAKFGAISAILCVNRNKNYEYYIVDNKCYLNIKKQTK